VIFFNDCENGHACVSVSIICVYSVLAIEWEEAISDQWHSVETETAQCTQGGTLGLPVLGSKVLLRELKPALKWGWSEVKGGYDSCPTLSSHERDPWIRLQSSSTRNFVLARWNDKIGRQTEVFSVPFIHSRHQSRKLKSLYGVRNRFKEPSLELSSQAT
jgi:hypothetical protein